MTTKEVILQPYHWEEKDAFGIDEQLEIHGWCFDRESRPHLVRIPDFPVFCHIELPEFVDGVLYPWSESRINVFTTWLGGVLMEDRPKKISFREAKKLYFYRGDKTYPTLLASFNTKRAMDHCANLLKKPRIIPDIGTVQCHTWEQEFTSILKMLTFRRCGFSQWFRGKANIVPPEHHISTLPPDQELTISFREINPIPTNETTTWTTHPKVLIFDIECYSPRHSMMPQQWLANHNVFSISAITGRLGLPSYPKNRHIVVFGDCDDFDEEDGNKIVIHKIPTEVEVIRRLEDIIVKEDPDIISGYNIFGFDYPYMSARLERVGQGWRDIGRLINVNATIEKKSWKSDAFGYNEIKILNMPGRISIDMFPLIKREYKLSKYDLDTVCKHFLGKGKHDIKIKDMFRSIAAFHASHIDLSKILANVNNVSPEEYAKAKTQYLLARSDLTKYLKYNLQDSELVDGLLSRNVWPGLVEMSNIVSVTIMTLFTRGQQVRCVSLVYRYAVLNEYIVDRQEFNYKSITGAHVFETIPGIHEPVICYDVMSMYPSIMILKNICFSTLVPPELFNEVPDDQCHHLRFNQIEGDLPEEEDEENEFETKTSKKNIPTKVVDYEFKWYKGRKGILPQIAEDLLTERKRVKDLLKTATDPTLKTVYDIRQLALKGTANSLYGFTSILKGSKMPLPQAGMCITATGRETIKMVASAMVERHGAVIISGDSVTSDTPLLIKYPDGHITYTTIEDLGDASFDPKAFEKNKPEDKQIVWLYPENLQVWSDQGWTRIRTIIRHKTSKQLFRVLTHTGVVDVTEDHSLLDKEGREIRPTEIKVGGELLHNDLPNEINNTGCSDEKAWVWGFFFAEGTCGSYTSKSGVKNAWSICNQDRSLLLKCQEIMKKIEPNYNFIIDPCMQSSAVDKLNIRGKKLKEIVTRYRNLFYDRNKYKKVPDEILNAPVATKKAFFEGYYAGDGSQHEGRLRFDNKGKIGSAGLYYIASCIGYKIALNTRLDKPQIYRCNVVTGYNQFGPDEIKKIIPIGTTAEYVYDLETINHHFAAGVGKMIVHNTDSIFIKHPLVTSPKQCKEWGKKLLDEINGTVDKPGLLQKPIQMELEKSMRLIHFGKKKKYAWIPIKDNGEYSVDPKDIGSRGLPLNRREYCKWAKKVYFEILVMALVKKSSFKEVADYLITQCQNLLQGKVNYNELISVRELGGNYKNPNFWVKLFADNLRLKGQNVNPGDRLEFLIVDKPDEGKLLGNRMITPEQHAEEKQYEIDYLYYLEHSLMKPVDQLLKVAYEKDALALDLKYQATKRHGVHTLDELVKIIALMARHKQDIEALREVIVKTPK